MSFIDIHTHTPYQNPETTLVLNVFPDQKENMNLPVYKSVGLHPWHILAETWQHHLLLVEEAMNVHGVIAVGEAGLDRVIAVDYSLQKQVFSAQLHIAITHHLPMIIHCVRSYSEMLAFRKKSLQSLPWIFHWYNADLQTARELMRKNCYLSFGHMLFNEQSKAFRAFREIPLEHVFFETDDAGYSINEIYSRAATIRNCKVPELKKQILNNFARCFQV